MVKVTVLASLFTSTDRMSGPYCRGEISDSAGSAKLAASAGNARQLKRRERQATDFS